MLRKHGNLEPKPKRWQNIRNWNRSRDSEKTQEIEIGVKKSRKQKKLEPEPKHGESTTHWTGAKTLRKHKTWESETKHWEYTAQCGNPMWIIGKIPSKLIATLAAKFFTKSGSFEQFSSASCATPFKPPSGSLFEIISLFQTLFGNIWNDKWVASPNAEKMHETLPRAM